jgi:hypothetical protein
MKKTFTYCDQCKEEISNERPLANGKWLTLGKIRVKFSIEPAGTTREEDDEEDDDEDDEESVDDLDICVPCITKLLNQRALGVLPKDKPKVPLAKRSILRVKKVSGKDYYPTKANIKKAMEGDV